MDVPIRLFIAVNVPFSQSLRSVLRALDAIGRPVQTVTAETSHVTLKFLGETNSLQLSAMELAIGTVAAEQSPHLIQIEQMSAFPNSIRPSVIWAGLTNAVPLQEIAKRLDSLLEPHGFLPESRPYHPHLTLARIKGPPPAQLLRLMRKHQQTPFGKFEMTSIELYRSELHPSGPRYSVISSHKLGCSSCSEHAVGSVKQIVVPVPSLDSAQIAPP